MSTPATRSPAARSRLPARLDVLQSASGLFLALFMWAHMFFVASILLGPQAMYSVARFFEGAWVFGEPYPLLVSGVVAFVIVVFVVHAVLATRKFPASLRQWQAFREHRRAMRHEDTTLWMWQVYTGFAMFFLASVHLYTMLTRPDTIGPYGSADRVVSDWMWPLYLLLLFAVELHGSIGLYRLAVKWGWLEGRDPKRTRRNLKRAKWGLTVFFLALGLLTLAAYIRIGIEHRDAYGERYVPETVQEARP